MLIQFLILSLFLIVKNVSLQSVGSSFEMSHAADLLLDVNTRNGLVYLEAFGSKINDEIIQKKIKERYGQLRWVSLGNPQLKLRNGFHNSSISQIFEMRSDSFDIFIETLTNQDKILFSELVREIYNIEVKPDQILNLIPNNFICKMIFISNGQEFFFTGRAIIKHTSPVRVLFSAPEESYERTVFEEYVKNYGDKLNLDIVCTVSLPKSEIKENAFVLSQKEIINLGIIAKLLGNEEEKYVTRNQIAQLSTELYKNLNIFEKYEITEGEFKEWFVDEFIRQGSKTTLKNVDFEQAISKLSSYNLKEGLNSDLFKSSMSSIYRIVNENSIDNLKFDQNEYEKLTNKYESKKEGVFGRIKIKNEINENEDVIDKLAQLNRQKESVIEWTRSGNLIIPKSIRLAKISKSLLSTDMRFSQVPFYYQESAFKRSFVLNTLSIFNQISSSNFVSEENKLNQTNSNQESWNVMKSFYGLFSKLENESKKYDNIVEENLNFTLDFKDHRHFTESFYKLYFLSNGNLLGYISAKEKIKIWNGNNGSLIKEIFYSNHWSEILSIAELKNGNLATGLSDHTILIWNLNDGTVKRELSKHKGFVETLTVLPNGNLASGSADTTIKIWNPDNGSLIRTLKGHTDQVLTLTVLKNGNLVSGSADATIKIWNSNDGSLIRTFEDNFWSVSSLAILPDGHLASFSNGLINIFDPYDGSLLKTIFTHFYRYHCKLFVLPDGNLAINPSWNRLTIWDPYNESIIGTLNVPFASSLFLLPDSNLAYGLEYGTIKKVTLKNTFQKSNRTFIKSEEKPKTWLIMKSYFRLIQKLEDNFKQKVNIFSQNLNLSFTKDYDRTYSLTVLSNGNLVRGSHKEIKIWNTNNGSIIRTLPGHSDRVLGLTVLQNGNLASCSEDKTIKIWNPNDGSLIRTIEGHFGPVNSLIVLPDGYLGSCSQDKTIKIWNPNNGSLMQTIEGHSDSVNSLIVLPDGNIASASKDKTINIWNPNDWSLKRILKGHFDSVNSLVILQDGNLASSSDDKLLNIWNLNDGSLMKTIVDLDTNNPLAVLPNGNLLSGSSSGTIKIWNTNDGSLIGIIKDYVSFGKPLLALSDGNLVYSNIENTLIKIWL